ncbi:protein PIN-LIKES 3-like isoform X1 [Dioscorea cayenensis subsp. rotundata]|uniref:Protein PIN-LIKES 3-like isoform X1 n=2 Tax=Dioscorea cayennensis subsp. rotundata TaxID=55577 RepID=A0AB40BC41_DIOCR|nr:protein PIN-LIKES 3-like isoform X1 [Dioscorea cayenensis subsp. rotundata]
MVCALFFSEFLECCNVHDEFIVCFNRLNNNLLLDFIMGLWDLFVTASVPILNVLLVAIVGAFLATNHIGILGEETRKHLNNVVFYAFNPALEATNMARTITMESMALLWFMPLNLLLNFIIGSMLAWILIHIAKAPTRLRAVIFATCSAGNVGNLLLVLIPAMCKEKGSTLGPPDVCHNYALAYACLSMATCTVLQWSYVFNIVRISSTSIKHKMNHEHALEENISLLPKSCTNEMVIPLNKFERLLMKFSRAIDLKKLFAPSTIGVIIGFIIGVVPQIRKAMIGENAPLRPIHDSATLLGKGAIPSLILMMGGNLTKGLRGSEIKFSLIIGVLLIRYMALPLLGIAIVKGAIHLGIVHSDPLYQFTLLMQYAVPPAMNITSMIQMFDAGVGELAVIFLWAYAVAAVTLTLWSTLFLWLVS